MRLKRFISRLLAVLVTVWALLLSPALQVDAAAGDLYGTGSADEINIIKLLDMALNKGGMSMSPATIRSFLEYWWTSVQADLSTCIGNADSAITTTQAFADYVISALEDADHYDKLGPIIIKYVQYVCAMEGKSLSDIKQLLLQPDTFRRFLLSYVVDEDGNIAGTVDNKLKKYQLKDALVDMVRQAADAYIEEYEGYYLVKTFTINDLNPTDFTTKDSYDAACNFLKNVLGDELVCFTGGSANSKQFTRVLLMDGLSLVNTSYSQLNSLDPLFSVYTYSDNWEIQYAPFWQFSNANSDSFPNNSEGFYKPYANRYDIYVGKPHLISNCMSLFTKDGRSVKIWKTLDAFKAASAGKSNIYYSSNYAGYDSSVDNSVEFTGSYYSSNSYSHDVIQNNIDNSSEINESTINNIVNNYITNNNYGDSSGSSGSGGGSGSSGGWWNIGDGIAAFIEGVAAIFDFLLKLLGDLIGLIGTFLVNLLAVLEELAVVGSSFGDFLKAFFAFIPDECISLIISGIGFMVVVGIIKMFKD